MNSSYEVIHFNKEIPINLLLHSVGFVKNHWHDAIEILFVLEGSIRVIRQGMMNELHTEDIFILCPNEIHSITSSEKNVLLLLQISKEFVESNLGQNFTLKEVIDEKHLYQLKKILAEMIWISNKKSSFYFIQQSALLYSFLYTLARECLNFSTLKKPEVSKNNERIEQLINFIQDNYRDSISLEILSEQFHLTPAYVSRYFKNKIGLTFKSYLTNLRFEHAVKQMISTDKNILDISLESGFPNAKSLSLEFKRVYSGTIFEYRQKYKQNKEIVLDIKRPKTNYTELENHEYFATLFKYLNLTDQPSENKHVIAKTINSTISYSKSNQIQITPYWKNLTSISRAKDLLRFDIRQLLIELQKDIGFSAIRFHGIFDDPMMVYQEDENGHVRLNFDYIDSIFDFLLSINLKPFIEIGFMPKALAKNKTPYFYSPVYPSPPTDIKKWLQLLTGFITHVIQRYTKNEVITWHFEFWNEPELLNVFWKGTDQEFLNFYLASYKELKRILPELKIGGPSISQISNTENWLENYFNFCKQEGCLPDFFTSHFYPHDEAIDALAYDLLTGNHFPRISPNPNLLNSYIDKITFETAKYDYSKDSIHITEWNSSASHNELTHDTLYKACYLVKNIVNNFNKVSSLSHWTLSDIIEEYAPSTKTFHGGIGLITKEGIKKAGYYAYNLLNKLGDRLIYSSEHMIITCKDSDVQILMFNYCHFDELYCNNDRSMINDLERYYVYSNNETIQLVLKLIDLPFTNGQLTEYTLSQEFGSAYDTWLTMGHPAPLTQEAIDILKNVKPKYETYPFSVDSTMEINRLLGPHEVKLILLQPL